jgi:hypothetical protein
MRTLCTALAFLIMLWAVLPAVRRSVSAPRQNAGSDRPGRRGECHAQHHGEHAGLYRRCAVQVGVGWQGVPRDWMTAPFIFGQ